MYSTTYAHPDGHLVVVGAGGESRSRAAVGHANRCLPVCARVWSAARSANPMARVLAAVVPMLNFMR